MLKSVETQASNVQIGIVHSLQQRKVGRPKVVRNIDSVKVSQFPLFLFKRCKTLAAQFFILVFGCPLYEMDHRDLGPLETDSWIGDDSSCRLFQRMFEDRSVTELCGAHGSAKSLLVYQAVAVALSKRSIGGKDGTAFVFDCDASFSISAFRNLFRGVLRRRALSAGDGTSDPTVVEKLVTEGLSKLYVLKCNSLLNLIASLKRLALVVQTTSGFKFVVVDGLGSFYWASRVEGDLGANLQAAFGRAIRELLADMHISVIGTRTLLSADRSARDFTPRSWQLLVRHRWIVSKLSPTGNAFLLRDPVANAAGAADSSAVFHVTDEGVRFGG
jgi:hypothetical protein